MELNKVVKFLDDYLDIKGIEDYSFNGLQFEGKKEVDRIVFMVDSGLSSLKLAVENKADMIVVHHGLFWKGMNPSVVSVLKNKLEVLFKNNVSLYAAHLPLDRHREVGNNAEILKMLGARIKEEFVFSGDKNIGWIGEFEKKRDFRGVVKDIDGFLNTKSVFIENKRKVKRIGVCSGGGNFKDLLEAIDKKVDLFVTGDRFDAYHLSKDYGINVVFAGHYATETTGIKALSRVVEERLGVKVVFVDNPTGL